MKSRQQLWERRRLGRQDGARRGWLTAVATTSRRLAKPRGRCPQRLLPFAPIPIPPLLISPLAVQGTALRHRLVGARQHLAARGRGQGEEGIKAAPEVRPWCLVPGAGRVAVLRAVRLCSPRTRQG